MMLSGDSKKRSLMTIKMELKISLWSDVDE